MADGPLIITIARQLGSGGSELAQHLAHRLGIAYLDRQILRQVAAALGVEEGELASRCECLQGFWTRLLQSFAQGSPADVFSPPPFRVPSDEQIMDTERSILLQLAAKGDCVVVGHAGFQVLRGTGRLLNVFVHAPQEFRVRRVLRYYPEAARDEAGALEAMARSDEDRARYVAKATGLEWQDARNYHLSLDAARVGLDAAGDFLVSLARGMATA